MRIIEHCVLWFWISSLLIILHYKFWMNVRLLHYYLQLNHFHCMTLDVAHFLYLKKAQKHLCSTYWYVTSRWGNWYRSIFMLACYMHALCYMKQPNKCRVLKLSQYLPLWFHFLFLVWHAFSCWGKQSAATCSISCSSYPTVGTCSTKKLQGDKNTGEVWKWLAKEGIISMHLLKWPCLMTKHPSMALTTVTNGEWRLRSMQGPYRPFVKSKLCNP